MIRGTRRVAAGGDKFGAERRPRRIMRAPWPAVVAVLSIASACGAQAIESGIHTPLPDYVDSCNEQYAEGDLIDYGPDGSFSAACQDDTGALIVPVPVSLDCTDGPDLVYNDFAWGYEGNEMTLFESDDSFRRPDDSVVNDCLQRNASDGAAADAPEEAPE